MCCLRFRVYGLIQGSALSGVRGKELSGVKGKEFLGRALLLLASEVVSEGYG